MLFIQCVVIAVKYAIGGCWLYKEIQRNTSVSVSNGYDDDIYNNLFSIKIYEQDGENDEVCLFDAKLGVWDSNFPNWYIIDV